MSDLPAVDCPSCGQWIPRRYPVLVEDSHERTGARNRWVAIEGPGEALERHWAGGCTTAEAET